MAANKTGPVKVYIQPAAGARKVRDHYPPNDIIVQKYQYKQKNKCYRYPSRIENIFVYNNARDTDMQCTSPPHAVLNNIKKRKSYFPYISF